MNLFDYILLLLLIGACLWGYQRGLVLQVTSLFGFFISMWAAYQFADELAVVLHRWWQIPQLGQGPIALLPLDRWIYHGIAFVILFLVTKWILSLVAHLLNQVANLPLISLVNHWGGMGIGMVQMLLFFVILVNLLEILPWATGRTAVHGSLIAQTLIQLTPNLAQGIRDFLQGSPL